MSGCMVPCLAKPALLFFDVATKVAGGDLVDKLNDMALGHALGRGALYRAPAHEPRETDCEPVLAGRGPFGQATNGPISRKSILEREPFRSEWRAFGCWLVRRRSQAQGSAKLRENHRECGVGYTKPGGGPVLHLLPQPSCISRDVLRVLPNPFGNPRERAPEIAFSRGRQLADLHAGNYFRKAFPACRLPRLDRAFDARLTLAD